MGFINFHNHSEYSFLSSLLSVEKLVTLSKMFHYNGCALTDTLSTFGFYKLDKLCRQYGIKPVYGIEILTSNVLSKGHFPIILIALNRKGLENIFEINNYAHQSYQRKNKYTLPFEIISSKKSGLAVIAETEFITYIDQPELLEMTAVRYKEEFNNHFFIAINYTGEKKIPTLKKLIQVSDQYSITPLAACESRYWKDDKETFELLLDYKKHKFEKNDMKFSIDKEMDFTFRNKEDFYYYFRNHIQFIDQSEKLFEQIETDWNTRSFHIPAYFKTAWTN